MSAGVVVLEGESGQSGQVEELEAGRFAGQHRTAFHGVDGDVRVGRDHVGAGAAVGVGGPGGQLGVVREAGRNEAVGVPAAGYRVRRLRHVDAEVVTATRELHQDPAVGLPVVNNDGVTAAVGAGPGTQTVELERGQLRGRGLRLVPNPDQGATAVGGLDDVIRADVAHRVGRAGPGEGDPREVAGRTGDRLRVAPGRGERGLQVEERIGLLDRRRQDAARGREEPSRDLARRVAGAPGRRGR